MSPRSIGARLKGASEYTGAILGAFGVLQILGGGLLYLSSYRGLPERMSRVERTTSAILRVVNAQLCLERAARTHADERGCYLPDAIAGGDVTAVAFRLPPAVVSQ